MTLSEKKENKKKLEAAGIIVTENTTRLQSPKEKAMNSLPEIIRQIKDAIEKSESSKSTS